MVHVWLLARVPKVFGSMENCQCWSRSFTMCPCSYIRISYQRASLDRKNIRLHYDLSRLRPNRMVACRSKSSMLLEILWMVAKSLTSSLVILSTFFHHPFGGAGFLSSTVSPRCPACAVAWATKSKGTRAWNGVRLTDLTVGNRETLQRTWKESGISGGYLFLMGYEVVDGNINGNIHGIHHQQSEICVSPVCLKMVSNP